MQTDGYCQNNITRKKIVEADDKAFCPQGSCSFFEMNFGCEHEVHSPHNGNFYGCNKESAGALSAEQFFSVTGKVHRKVV